MVTAVTRLCIDRLRAVRDAREVYVGPWLPEPLVGDVLPGVDTPGAVSQDAVAPAADAPVELASNLSIAFLVVLERLAPEERAAFLLHEVFDSEYAEIAQILGKSEAACRQIVSRARKRVRENRPRVEVSEAAPPRTARTLRGGDPDPGQGGAAGVVRRVGHMDFRRRRQSARCAESRAGVASE